MGMESERDLRSGTVPADMPLRRKEGIDRPRLTPAYTIAHTVSTEDCAEIAQDAYIYAFPLVLMELSRRAMTNVPEPNEAGLAPMNRFGHRSTFQESRFPDYVRANVDTVHSTMFYDVSRQPLVVTVPDSGGRFYLLPVCDMWTDVFASPGKRTTGTGAQAFAIVGPNWHGKLPDGVRELRSPTSLGRVVGRTQTNGVADLPSVRKFQAGLRTAPLSEWGAPHRWLRADVNPAWSSAIQPVDLVAALHPAAFYGLFMDLIRDNPPHAQDHPILDRLRRIGLERGKPFDFAQLSPPVQRALREGTPVALARVKERARRIGELVNGWHTNQTAIGSYGTNYLGRAAVAYGGLGANSPEDAVYPTAVADADGKPFTSEEHYTLHFDKTQLPPVRGFWSLTMYDERQNLVANPISRYAIGDRETLPLNPDGSLDILIQRESPGRDQAANWLPAPPSGPFSMSLRLYWPKADVLTGDWTPPPVRRT